MKTSVLAMLAGVFLSTSVLAGPIPTGLYLDDWVGNGPTNNPSMANPPDVIGSPEIFDIYGMNLGSGFVQVLTRYAGRAPTDGFTNVVYGDLLLGTAAPDRSGFDAKYAFVLDDPNASFGFGSLVSLAGNGDLRTSNDVLGASSGIIYRDKELVEYAGVSPTNKPYQWSVIPSPVNAPGSITFYFPWQTLLGVNAMQWTMSCGNDVIRIAGNRSPDATVDETTSIAYFGIGLLMLGFTFSRSTKPRQALQA